MNLCCDTCGYCIQIEEKGEVVGGVWVGRDVFKVSCEKFKEVNISGAHQCRFRISQEQYRIEQKGW